MLYSRLFLKLKVARYFFLYYWKSAIIICFIVYLKVALGFKRASQQTGLEFYKTRYFINNGFPLTFQYTNIIEDIYCPSKWTNIQKKLRSIQFQTLLPDLLMVIHSASVSLLAGLFFCTATSWSYNWLYSLQHGISFYLQALPWLRPNAGTDPLGIVTFTW